MAKLDLEAVLNLKESKQTQHKRPKYNKASKDELTSTKTALHLNGYTCCTILLWGKERKRE